MELAKQLAALFLEETPQQLSELSQALAGKDAEAAERIAHSIKSASAVLGGGFLRQIAYTAEQCSHDKKFEEARSLIPQLEKHFADLRQALYEAGYQEIANP